MGGPFVQQEQPEGVPALELTGERTLPDVPAENYWFRRHLAVYEWIARRERGASVLDMACGEGYGSEVLARSGRSVVGVDADQLAHEHARLRYAGGNLRFERALIQAYTEPAEAIVFLQTVEHLQEPACALEHLRSLLLPGGHLYVSTPNVLRLAPAGAARSDNPWHLREYRAEEFAALLERCFGEVALYGLHHAHRLRLHELALRLGWDRVHRRLRLTERFYDRFTPSITTRDFRLLAGGAAALQGALDFLAVCRA